MPKIVGTRERVHQPFYDSLIRTDGSVNLRTNPGVNQLSGRVQLFLRSGAELAISNLTTGGTFPSDQTFITLAVRVWTYFRFNPENTYSVPKGPPAGPAQAVGTVPGVFPDRIMRVHKLYHQSENQLFWQFQAGDKPQLTTFTAYTPFAGGLDGFFSDSRLPRANNGVPHSGALMRLARPILIPPRQGFQCIATLSSIGQAPGASIVEQLLGSIDGSVGPSNAITASPGPGPDGLYLGNVSVNGTDDIEKDIKYLIDGIHSRDVL
jgi:hypothetical protein